MSSKRRAGSFGRGGGGKPPPVPADRPAELQAEQAENAERERYEREKALLAPLQQRLTAAYDELSQVKRELIVSESGKGKYAQRVKELEAEIQDVRSRSGLASSLQAWATAYPPLTDLAAATSTLTVSSSPPLSKVLTLLVLVATFVLSVFTSALRTTVPLRPVERTAADSPVATQ